MRHVLIGLLLASSAFAEEPNVCPVQAPQAVHLQLMTDVNAFTGALLALQIRGAIGAKAPAIYIEINSPGGSAPAGFQIMEAIASARYYGVPTICHVRGEADSMAAFIFEVCSVRQMGPAARLMFHEIAVIAIPTRRHGPSSVRAIAADLEDDNQRACSMIAFKMKRPTSDVCDWIRDHQRYIDAMEAVKMNAADLVDAT